MHYSVKLNTLRYRDRPTLQFIVFTNHCLTTSNIYWLYWQLVNT